MAILGALLLVAVLLLRPMEFVPGFARLHSLETLTGITLIGIGVEASGRRARIALPPQLPWLLAFVCWGLGVTTIKLGSKGLSLAWSVLGLSAIFMLLVAFAVTSKARLHAFVAVLAATLAMIAAIAVHQGQKPRQCIEIVTNPGEDEEQTPDGRECEGAHACEEDGKPGADYICERVGALGTISTMGRVRYRGQLDDPNELSVFLAAGLPLIMLLGGRRRATQIFVLGPIVVVSLWAIVLSQSRTGQMVIGTLVLIGLVRRYRVRGAVFAAGVIPVIMLLGGRDDGDGSSLERASILYEGIDLVRAHPLLGVGVQQFHDEISIPLTAHNAYLLAAAELGVVGLVLWGGLLWSSMKIAITVATSPPPGIDPDLIRFAKALALSLASMCVGIFFLSFSYKQLLFVWLGLAAALYSAVRAQAPSFRVRTTVRDVLGVCVCSVAVLILIFVISRIKAT